LDARDDTTTTKVKESFFGRREEKQELLMSEEVGDRSDNDLEGLLLLNGQSSRVSRSSIVVVGDGDGSDDTSSEEQEDDDDDHNINDDDDDDEVDSYRYRRLDDDMPAPRSCTSDTGPVGCSAPLPLPPCPTEAPAQPTVDDRSAALDGTRNLVRLSPDEVNAIKAVMSKWKPLPPPPSRNAELVVKALLRKHASHSL
jgi:hypothetical protein